MKLSALWFLHKSNGFLNSLFIEKKISQTNKKKHLIHTIADTWTLRYFCV